MTSREAIRLAAYAQESDIGVVAIPMPDADLRWVVCISLANTSIPPIIVDEYRTSRVQLAIGALWGVHRQRSQREDKPNAAPPKLFDRG